MTPFEIDPAQIAQLGSAFGAFIALLLETEQAAHGIGGHRLTFNRNENTPDGGVDAATADAIETDWLPPGDSAWQFKQSNLSPAACAAELEDATWAHDYLRHGGHYVMVLGKHLTDQQIKARTRALEDKAVALGLIADTPADRARIRVYDANHLARWASLYPALTLDPALHIPLGPMVAFDHWRSSRHHQDKWVPEAQRTQISQKLVAALKSARGFEFRVEGPSGIGKTRLVMEALQDDELCDLVAYGPDAAAITPAIIGYLTAKQRTAVLVIDECDRRSHEKLAEQIPMSANLRLVTIGHADARPLSVPMFAPGPMPPTDIETVLKENRPELWVEARRFVSENCAGNVKMAYVLADRLREAGAGHAAELMQRGDLESILAIVFPTDESFFFMAALAMFDRVGWDGELEAELRVVAEFCGTTVANLKRVGVWLEEHGLLAKQGRYRAVVPNPAAVYLAAKAWDLEGQRIVDELLPKLSQDMLTALFARVADLGRYEPASRVLEQLLASRGLFGTLDDIARRDVGGLLVQLAIVAPERTVEHVGRLIAAASLDELRQQSSVRRSLVHALEKLAWHTTTFRPAAQALLRLALAENESYANNATGAWVSLFGMVLPTTAASPAQRLAYLQELVNDDNPRVRALVVAACEAGIGGQETAVVSPELQQGVAVEPRGSVRTYGEAADYGEQLITLLSHLAEDHDDEVARAAFKALAERLHPAYLLNGLNGPQLQAALVALGARFNRELRAEIARARGWAARTNDGTFVELLDALVSQLPNLASIDKLQALAGVGAWEFSDAALKRDMNEAVAEALANDGLITVLRWLSSEEVRAAAAVGGALADVTHASNEVRDTLVRTVKDPTALAGFLSASVALGDEAAFDNFIDSEAGKSLDPEAQLFLTMRGPASPSARARAGELALTLSPRKAAWALVGWGHELEPSSVAALVAQWRTVEDQADYAAVIDWLAFWAHGRVALPESIRALVWELLNRRIDFTDMGQTGWDWCELARYFVPSDAVQLARLLCDMAVGKELMLANREEARLLTECATQDPVGVWSIVASYLAERDWRLVLDLQDWFVRSIPVEIVTDWIGDSPERARIVARIANPGTTAPTQLAKFLLTQFPDDQAIAAELSAQYATGVWSGSWSSHLTGQIEQLQSWIRDEGASSPVGKWAQGEIDTLTRELKLAAQEEEERR